MIAHFIKVVISFRIEFIIFRKLDRYKSVPYETLRKQLKKKNKARCTYLGKVSKHTFVLLSRLLDKVSRHDWARDLYSSLK